MNTIMMNTLENVKLVSSIINDLNPFLVERIFLLFKNYLAIVNNYGKQERSK
ncbi:MAG: hypothetical protein ACJAV6_000377 [Candidatus Paceibacteria bacterium]|jgi:hypothetical protein